MPDTTSPACRPRLRQQTFDTAIIERYRRRQRSVEEALIEMYPRTLGNVMISLPDVGHGKIAKGQQAVRPYDFYLVL